MGRPSQDIRGMAFSRLTVIRRNGQATSGNALWLCRCECGNKITTSGSDIRHGKTKSCGCLNSQSPHRYKHGAAYTRLWRLWKGMRERCEDPRRKAFLHYGARGISLCKEWHHFPTFKEWAHTHGYADDLTIERRNVNGNYEPSNCLWIPGAQQSLNTTRIKRTADGQPWHEIAKKNGIKPTLMASRIHQGWPIESAATLPVGSRFR